MLKQRLVTAFVLIGLVIGILFFAPGWAFNLLLMAVLVLSAWEWGRMSGLRSRRAQLVYPQVVLVVVIGCQWLIQQGLMTWVQPFGVATVWWLIALLMVMTYPASGAFWRNPAFTAFIGILVLAPGVLALEFLRAQAEGQWLVLLVLTLVGLADSGAYFVGRAFGKHKLAPAVSPGKTWEGVAGGLATAALLAVAVSLISGKVPLLTCLVVLLPAALFSVLGDLFESMVKRQRGIKDSSQLLPGHGGFMDRIDGLTAAAPVFALGILLTGWTF